MSAADSANCHWGGENFPEQGKKGCGGFEEVLLSSFCLAEAVD
jgi:hypothetical protein